jgi:putative ABC transport system substrate-binding protein
MFNPDTSPQSDFFMRSISAAGLSLSIKVTATPIRAKADIEPSIANFARQPNGGLVLPTDSFTLSRFKLIADTANRHRLPSLAASAEYVKDGCLMYYGISEDSTVERYRTAGNYVDRILKGEKPGNLPVQNPTRYELVINMRTAKALGLAVPLSLLASADEVIE